MEGSSPVVWFQDETPTKPAVLTMPDYRARLAAYRAVSTSEMGSLEGPVTTWDAVCVVVDAYKQALFAQRECEDARWRDLARNEARHECSSPDCDCRGLR